MNCWMKTLHATIVKNENAQIRKDLREYRDVEVFGERIGRKERRQKPIFGVFTVKNISARVYGCVCVHASAYASRGGEKKKEGVCSLGDSGDGLLGDHPS